MKNDLYKEKNRDAENIHDNIHDNIYNRLQYNQISFIFEVAKILISSFFEKTWKLLYFVQIRQTRQTNIYLDITRIRPNYRSRFTHHKPSTTYLELRKPRTRTVSIGLISASSAADERHRINQMDGNAIHARERNGMVGNGKTGAYNASEKWSYVALRTRQIGPRSDACYKSFRFIFHARWRARLALFLRHFRLVLTAALFRPISGRSPLGPSFGKPPFCSRSECVRDDKRLASHRVAFEDGLKIISLVHSSRGKRAKKERD